MSEQTWKEYLKDIFKDFDSSDQIDLAKLVDGLRAQGTSGLENIDSSLARPEFEATKKEIAALLWDLAHIEEKAPDKQREIYAKLAGHYDKLFEWEDVSSPGWFVIPGPFFP
jgi:hypothetical protein